MRAECHEKVEFCARLDSLVDRRGGNVQVAVGGRIGFCPRERNKIHHSVDCLVIELKKLEGGKRDRKVRKREMIKWMVKEKEREMRIGRRGCERMMMMRKLHRRGILTQVW